MERYGNGNGNGNGHRHDFIQQGLKPLEPYAFSYFDHLCAEFETLCSKLPKTSSQTGDSSPEDFAFERANEIYGKKNDGPITMGDLYAFETEILRLQPEERLGRRAYNLRAKYQDIAGRRLYEEYLASNPPKTLDAGLREDLENILGEFHWMYTITPEREEIRARVSKRLSLSAGIVVGTILVLGLLYYALVADSLPVLGAVLIMGVLGAYVSIQRRLQTASSEGDPIVGILELQKSKFNVTFVALISGAVFAGLLYLMFIGQLVQGSLFPGINYSTPQSQTEEVTTLFPKVSAFLASFGPATVADIGKLLVWSFIAGFAERFVPDALDRLGAYKLTSVEPKQEA